MREELEKRKKKKMARNEDDTSLEKEGKTRRVVEKVCCAKCHFGWQWANEEHWRARP